MWAWAISAGITLQPPFSSPMVSRAMGATSERVYTTVMSSWTWVSTI